MVRSALPYRSREGELRSFRALRVASAEPNDFWKFPEWFVATLATQPLHRLFGKLIECSDGHFQVLFFCVLDFVVTDAVQTSRTS